MRQTPPISDSTSAYVEVLTAKSTGSAFGYRLVGAAAGPQIVVAGSCRMAEVVFERLLSIPTLPWMRGNLILVHLNLLDDLSGDLAAISAPVTIDRTLILPWSDAEKHDELFVRREYRKILRSLTELGMIAGRGVMATV